MLIWLITINFFTLAHFYANSNKNEPVTKHCHLREVIENIKPTIDETISNHLPRSVCEYSTFLATSTINPYKGLKPDPAHSKDLNSIFVKCAMCLAIVHQVNA